MIKKPTKQTDDWPDTHCPECNADRGEPCMTKHDKKAKQPHKNRTTENDLMQIHGEPLNEYIIDPPDDRIIDDGQYITILRPPHVNNFQWLEPGMTFWATHGDTRNPKGFLPDGKYKIVAHTPEGDVHLFPYEYCVLNLETIRELYSEEEFTFHANDLSNDELTEHIYYLKSRGIPQDKALGMALGIEEESGKSLNKNVGWFEPSPEVSAMISMTF